MAIQRPGIYLSDGGIVVVVSDGGVVIFCVGLGLHHKFGRRTQLMHAPRVSSVIRTMRNLHTLLGAQQGFRHELATNYAFLNN